MELIQIFIVIFALFAFSRAILRLKSKDISTRRFFFWGLLWIIVITITIIPEIMSFISDLTGLGRGVDFFVYLGIIILFYFTFKMYILIDKMREEITKLTREISYLKKDKKNNSKTIKKKC